MGVTQAWADYSITGKAIHESSDWTYDHDRWTIYETGMYDNYTSNPSTTTELVSPKMTPAKLGQKITVSGYRGGYNVSQLKFYVSFDEKQTWNEVGDKGTELHNTDYPTIGTFDSDEFVAYGNYYVKIVVLGIYLTKFEIADIELSPKTVYLAVNDDWKTANARFALYTKNGVTNVETWVDFEAVEKEYDIYSASVPVGTTLIIPCRMNPASTENNWDNKWNQTQDITTINDNALYTISGWTYASTGTYTPSTYSMTAGDAIAFGTIHAQATKTFTLTNTGTGALKNISIVSDNSNFTITNAPTELAAGASQEVTVTMLADQKGEQTGNITISAQWAENVVLGVSGTYAEAANMTIYLNTGANNEWGASNAQFVAWYWGGNVSGKAVVFNAVTGETNTYSAVISGQATGVKLYRVESASADFNPNNSSFWNQSDDLTPADNALFTFSSWADGNFTNFTTGTFAATGFVETFDGLTTNSSYTLNHSELPDWTISNGWGAFKSGNDVILYNYDNDGTAVLPCLYVSGTNDTFHFWAYDRYTQSPSGVIKFEYAASADAETWIQVYSKTGFASSMTEYTFSGIPAGNWYIRMTVNDAAIGKVQGFTQTLHTQTATETATEYGLVDGVYDLTMTRTIAEGPNPMCLPFDVKKADFQRIFGEEATVLEFAGYVDGKVNLTKKDIDNLDVVMTSGTPYVVYSYNTASEMSFNNVNIDGTAAKTVQPAGQEGQFIGTYVKMCPGQKFFAISNKEIKSVKATVNIKGFRAYFLLPTTATSAKMVIDGVEDADATAISLVETDEGNGNLYDLSGRRVNNAQKGIYIQNGKKFVVK